MLLMLRKRKIGRKTMKKYWIKREWCNELFYTLPMQKIIALKKLLGASVALKKFCSKNISIRLQYNNLRKTKFIDLFTICTSKKSPNKNKTIRKYNNWSGDLVMIDMWLYQSSERSYLALMSHFLLQNLGQETLSVYMTSAILNESLRNAVILGITSF